MRRLASLAVLALTLAAAAALAGPSPAQRLKPFDLSQISTGPLSFRDTILSPTHARRLQAARQRTEWGGDVTAADGELLHIYVSNSYPVDPTFTQGLADFLVQLYHGSELSTAQIHVETYDDLSVACGPGAGGCYDPDTEMVVIPGENLPDGTSKETVLVHELGHNVARNRINPPWIAEDWGTKRWATAERVCTRTAAGTAFPGDEGANYGLNPGEAFAESYRILNFQKQAWQNWPVLTPFNVDQTFYPSPGALDALKQDVLDAWTAPTVATWTARVPSAKRGVKRLVSTPLDGSFSVKLTRAPAGASVLLVNPSTGKVLAKGPRRASLQICGGRGVQILVRAAKPGPFSATYAMP